MELKLKNITYRRENHTYLDNISYTFEKEKINLIIGPSGSGKSILTKIIMGLEKDYDGNILLENKKIDNLLDIPFKVGYAFQKSSYSFFNGTVYKELEFGLNKYKYRLSKKDKQIKDSLKIVGLSEDYLKLNPFKLSYGEQSLLALAIILSFNPKIIILDEPFIGLDNKNKKNIGNILIKLVRRYHKTIIFTSSFANYSLKIADNILVLNNGKIVVEGTKKEVLKKGSIFKENNIDIPPIIEFVDYVRKEKHISLEYTLDIKDLIKDIYRHV